MPYKKKNGNRHSNCVLRKRVAYALRPPLPSSWICSPSGPRLWTFTWSKPEGGGEEGGEEGSEEAGEDSEEDVPLAEEDCTGLIKDSRVDHVSWLYMYMH